MSRSNCQYKISELDNLMSSLNKVFELSDDDGNNVLFQEPSLNTVIESLTSSSEVEDSEFSKKTACHSSTTLYPSPSQPSRPNKQITPSSISHLKEETPSTTNTDIKYERERSSSSFDLKATPNKNSSPTKKGMKGLWSFWDNKKKDDPNQSKDKDDQQQRDPKDSNLVRQDQKVDPSLMRKNSNGNISPTLSSPIIGDVRNSNFGEESFMEIADPDIKRMFLKEKKPRSTIKNSTFDSQNEKILRIYVNDEESWKIFSIGVTMTVGQITYKMKEHLTGPYCLLEYTCHSLYERDNDLGIERQLRDGEIVSNIIDQWSSKSNSLLIFKKNQSVQTESAGECPFESILDTMQLEAKWTRMSIHLENDALYVCLIPNAEFYYFIRPPKNAPSPFCIGVRQSYLRTATDATTEKKKEKHRPQNRLHIFSFETEKQLNQFMARVKMNQYEQYWQKEISDSFNFRSASDATQSENRKILSSSLRASFHKSIDSRASSSREVRFISPATNSVPDLGHLSLSDDGSPLKRIKERLPQPFTVEMNRRSSQTTQNVDDDTSPTGLLQSGELSMKKDLLKKQSDLVPPMTTGTGYGKPIPLAIDPNTTALQLEFSSFNTNVH